MKSYLAYFLLIFSLFFGLLQPSGVITAQETDPTDYPTYIIQPGDTLASIAYQFGLSLDDLIEINNIEDPNAIPAGTEIILPGMQGISGTLTTTTITLGDTLHALSVKYGISEADLIRINKLSSPTELYMNGSLIMPIQDDLPSRSVIAENNGQYTLLELAVLNNVSIWQLNAINQKEKTWDYQKLETIFNDSIETPTSHIALEIYSITIEPTVLKQGDIAIITVLSNTALPELTGSLDGRTIHFFEEQPNTYVAYQGIHAKTEPGLMSFSLTASEGEKAVFALEQMIPVDDSLYPFESLIVDPQTIDPETMDAEQAMILELTSPATTTKYFDSTFQCVVDQPVCIRSFFGTNRDYNDGVYYNFHSGLDYGVCATLNIYAPADGVVVYTGLLTVRGNATYIDHGWGVYSGFFHQDQILVKEGDVVETGQLIGIIGATGRVTGAHLHYEIIVNGVHVNPLQWLDSICK